MLEVVKWKDIYVNWKLIAGRLAPELLEPVHLEHIKFQYEDTNHSIYGYDWIYKDDYKERINEVTKNSFSFLFFGDSLNKGTLQTADYLIKAKDDSELLAAVWLYSFITDILNDLPENLRGNSFRWLRAVQHGILSKLKDKNMLWHHSMRRLLPEFYFSYVLDDLEIKGYDSIIELGVINAKLIKNHYVIVLYNSYREGK
ncbi:hypothetical protein [Lentibacillus sp. CBA3610]|uniref:hypothetical protein n=1 Tax=Lentibacillus sp. CBA3610 TaxID=2518176 RepID=UPI00159625B3|nr:hypothetical protein [Lentibacillus sp. CBA3610]QKY70199.1 hypothetical protein Len3610_11885 [Lentibacillus sp. CBA3610]